MATALPAPDDQPRRRLRRSRGFVGGGSAHSTHSESLRMSSDETYESDDEVDESINPNLNARVRALPPPDTPAPAIPYPDDHSEAADGGNPRARLNDVAMAGSRAYAKEYRLRLLHRLLMRNVPLDQIAQQLQVSISTVEKDRAELRRMLREHARELDINELIGNQSAVYDELRGMAMRVASSGRETPQAMKLAAMRTALAAEADRTRFLNTAGVFDVLKFRRSEEGDAVSDIQTLMDRTDEALAALMRGDQEATDVGGDDPPPSAPRRVTRSRNGFDSMSFDDPGASNSSDEIVQL